MEVETQSFVEESVDHLFRHHAGQMVTVLSRIFGLEKLDLIEDAVQDALVSALRKWPFTGLPDNPRGWLIEVSKNRLLDHIRRSSKFRSTEEEIESVENILGKIDPSGPVYFANEMSENQLRMIFACCHPLIAPDSQVALTLKVVSGFSVAEIARAFLAKNETVAKMIVRAKQTLRKHKVELEIPPPSQIPFRLDTVTKVLYLMFNEGYAASGGEELIRRDLCHEAIRLSELLSKHPVTSSPMVHALNALFLFQGARLASRCGNEGELLLLSEQDRSLWDKNMLSRAMHHFRLSASGDVLSDYHLEAEIAAFHAFAEDFESTDWLGILKCYEALQKRKFSPVVELNKIIVLTKLEGAEKGLEELNKFQENRKLKDYNLFHITRANFLSEIGRNAEAIESYEKAISLTQNETIKRFLRGKENSLAN